MVDRSFSEKMEKRGHEAWEKSGMAKYEQLYRDLKKNIEKGELPVGSLLPGCRVLAEHCGVSYVTATKAVQLLVRDGLVRSCRGNGITVLRNTAGTDDKTSSVGLMLPGSGDLFFNLYNAILAASDKADLQPLPVGGCDVLEQLSEKERIRKFDKYAAMKLKSWIVHAPRELPLRLLAEKLRAVRDLAFVLHCDSAVEFPGANRILPDYRMAGHLALRYLLAKGAKNLIFITFATDDAGDFLAAGASPDTYDKELFSAFAEHGNCTVFQPRSTLFKDGDLKELKALFQRPDCGVFSVGDSRMVLAYRAADELGLKIGRDIHFVGLYNTSWCEVFTPALTSISINEEEIGRLAVQAIAEHWKNERVLVKPDLVIRCS